MPRAWAWLPLLLGWLPLWALYTTLVLSAHPRERFAYAAFHAVIATGIAALLGLGVWRATARHPWPRPLRATFVAAHAAGAVLYAVTFALLVLTVQALMGLSTQGPGPAGTLHLAVGPGWFPRLAVMGAWLYVMVAGVAYAAHGTERAARAEALATASQLAALRAQLNPHFLFNALHTVVHLIPREPARAARAAEQVAGLLRTAVEEDRDLVTLSEEWAVVERYLDVERVRFGDRLRVRVDLDGAALDAAVPSFALQTLVENAVRHGVEPSVEPTDIAVSARVDGDVLRVTVSDTGAGADAAALEGGGTGLRRLRERLDVLYGGRARLDFQALAGQGFSATLVVPHEE